MSSHPLVELAAAFRSEAATLQRWGAEALAIAAEAAACRVEDAVAEWWNEELTIAAAAAESGYSEGHLRRLVANCRLADFGSKGRPRIRRGDLPRKLSRQPSDEVDLVGEVLRAREQHGP